MIDQVIVAVVLSITSIVVSNAFTIIANIGKHSELKDNIKRVRIQRLEDNARHVMSFCDHVIKQVDISPKSRSWRGDGHHEPDYVHDFSKYQIDSTILLFELDKLKRRTNLFATLSILLPLCAIAGPLGSFLAGNTVLGVWWAGITLCVSAFYLLLYLLHSHKIADLE